MSCSPCVRASGTKPTPLSVSVGGGSFTDWLKAELADNNGSGYVKADVLDDGTLMVTVPGIDKIKRVIVADEKTPVRRVYHQDGKPEN